MDRCKICKQSLSIVAGQQCAGCGTVHCPLCGVATRVFVAERRILCRHVIAMACLDECDEDAGGWEYSPYVRWNIEVPKPPRDLDWTDTCRLVGAFGILIPLLNAYEEDGVDTAQLFDLLLEEVGVPVKRICWRLNGPGIPAAGESFGTDYFTPHPDEVREQVRALVARLKAGFERLADARYGVARTALGD